MPASQSRASRRVYGERASKASANAAGPEDLVTNASTPMSRAVGGMSWMR